MKTKLTAFLQLLRPVNFLITFLTAFVAVLICSPNNINFDIEILAGLSAGFTAIAGNIINDIFDIEIDRINRPDRPLPSEKISNNETLALYFIFILLSFILSWFINLQAFIIVAATTLMLYLYSKLLKRIPLVGNFVVAFLTGLVFIYGGVAVENPSAAIIPAAFAFLINLIREIVKDMQDIEGDKKAGAITFPVKSGFQNSKQIILFLSIILILFTLYPFLTKLYRIEYFIVVMIFVNPLLVYSLRILFKNDSPDSLNKISNLLKLNMVLGLISIYLGI